MHFEAKDDWSAGDMLRRLRFERGELRFYADYVRGRCMKTKIVIRKDGTFMLDTVNRGEAATRWIARDRTSVGRNGAVGVIACVGRRFVGPNRPEKQKP